MRALVVMLVSVLAGCGERELGPLAIEVGHGDPFVPVAEGAPLGFDTGAQAGYHFLINVRASGLARPGDPENAGDLDNPITQLWAYDEDGGGALLTLDPQVYALGYASRGGAYELGPHILQMFRRPEELAGHRIRIRVRVRDSAGRDAVAERTVSAFHATP